MAIVPCGLPLMHMRDGNTPMINAVSLLLIVGTSGLALANLYFGRKGE
jgi:spermidine/putrescine transport system permease protein